ncbi:MAG: hypothetical protein KAI17_24260, partial [Thiotrichaceae bacterium]|nr:hypothetical protein [Thiotrichaceae bacterium]
TGYLDAAGRCLVVLTHINAKDTIIVTLDSFGRRSPIGDIKRISKWITTGKSSKVAKSASRYANNKLKYYLSKSAAIPQIATISSSKHSN